MENEIIRIKIEKSSDPRNWYHKNIGEFFDVVDFSDEYFDYRNLDGSGCILKDDCTVMLPERKYTNEELRKWCKESIDMYPDKANNYRLGKTALMGLFMGEVMKISRGIADPKEACAMLKLML